MDDMIGFAIDQGKASKPLVWMGVFLGTARSARGVSLSLEGAGSTADVTWQAAARRYMNAAVGQRGNRNREQDGLRIA